MSFKSERGRKIWGYFFLVLGAANLVINVIVVFTGRRLMIPIMSILVGGWFIFMGFKLVTGRSKSPEE